MSNLSPAEQKYYDEMYSLFATSGWKQFQEQIQERFLSLNNVLSIKDSDEFKLTQGQLLILMEILNFEQTVRTTAELGENDQIED